VSQAVAHTKESSCKGSVIPFPHRRATKRGRRSGAKRAARLLVALAIAAGAAFLIVGFVENPAAGWMELGHRSAEYEVVEVTVRSGDTLWSLAREYGPAGMDIREAVDWIQRENGLTSPVLRPGQRILVPASLRR